MFPPANYNGPDSFTYKARDSHGDSNVVAVSLTVTPVNDPPTVVVAPGGSCSLTNAFAGTILVYRGRRRRPGLGPDADGVVEQPVGASGRRDRIRWAPR